MVHVSKCPLGNNQRGVSSVEFYHKEIPQKYCLGRIDTMTDEALEECKTCKDWVHGKQCADDFENHLKEIYYEIDS